MNSRNPIKHPLRGSIIIIIIIATTTTARTTITMIIFIIIIITNIIKIQIIDIPEELLITGDTRR